MDADPASIVHEMSSAGVERGTFLAIAVSGSGVAMVSSTGTWSVIGGPSTLSPMLVAVERDLRPRWVVWSRADSDAVQEACASTGAPLGSCWDVAAVHRLQHGGWRAEPGRVWAHHRRLDLATMPERGRAAHAPIDLFTAAERDAGDIDDPTRPDGHLRTDWGRPGWSPTPSQLEAWAACALEVAHAQRDERDHHSDRPRAGLVARSESTAELLCNELERRGLPLDRNGAEAIITARAGPRPRTESEAVAQRERRDNEVLRHVPGGDGFDLRSPGQVKSLLRRVGIEVEDTRAWRLESLVDAHPVVPALLAWRKDERIATAFGYGWLDEHLGDDGRLRGSWAGSDGAAGRMTASAGLHNMPAELRPAVVAEPGHLFVRSDLGQIEPRVLAAVSGDQALARASQVPDLYAGVAAALSVDRDVAKVAVLGAMYGQTTGTGAQALAQLRRAYPVAMAHLEESDRDARAGRDVVTYGGRRVVMDASGDGALPDAGARTRAAARGRYGRNASIQGAAAELFKMWAVTVRARVAEFGAEIVLCLHDELLVQVSAEHTDSVADAVDASLAEAAHRWAAEPGVRFVTDTSVVERWSDAK